MSWKSIAIAIVLIAFAGSAFAQYIGTVTPAYYDSQPRAVSGRQIATGTVTCPTLVALQADADSSITTAIIDLTGLDRLPGRVFFYFTASGLVGGTGTAEVQISMYWHVLSTETPGANAGYLTNACFLANFGQVSSSPLTTVDWGTASAVNFPFFLPQATGATRTPEIGPRYVSFKFEKEGAGHYTAGTMTLVWVAYAL